MISLIGDSHSLCFEGHEYVKPHWLGALTAFNLWKKNEIIEELIQEDRTCTELWFCFGYVDCHLHLYSKYKETGVPVPVITAQTVFTYLNYINWLREKYSRFHFAVMAVPPAGLTDNLYDFKYYADRETQHVITQEFNVGMHYLAQGMQPEFTFVNIWGNYFSPWPEKDFKDDKAHIKNEIAISYLDSYLKERDR
jgi:hypothetical protein